MEYTVNALISAQSPISTPSKNLKKLISAWDLEHLRYLIFFEKIMLQQIIGNDKQCNPDMASAQHKRLASLLHGFDLREPIKKE